MRSLALSLRRRGMLYPLVVKPLKDGSYQLIAGERRLRAAREAGLKEVPVIERQANIDYELIEMGIENIQREDLSFYERGRWVAKMKEMGWLITSLAEETGIPQANLSNWLAFYEESERISSVTDEQFEPEKLPLE
jgi:ParB family chromosome partitioning protein